MTDIWGRYAIAESKAAAISQADGPEFGPADAAALGYTAGATAGIGIQLGQAGIKQFNAAAEQKRYDRAWAKLEQLAASPAKKGSPRSSNMHYVRQNRVTTVI